MSKQAVYIAGPMKGLPDLNYPAFHAAAKAWLAKGFYVENPADCEPGQTIADYSHEGFNKLLSCDAIALLPGWEQSVGAKAELHVAQLCEMPVYDALTFQQIFPGKVRTIITQQEPTPVGGAR